MLLLDFTSLALEKERAAHAREIEDKGAAIATLKDELQALKTSVAIRRKFAAKETAASTAAKQRSYLFTGKITAPAAVKCQYAYLPASLMHCDCVFNDTYTGVLFSLKCFVFATV